MQMIDKKNVQKLNCMVYSFFKCCHRKICKQKTLLPLTKEQ